MSTQDRKNNIGRGLLLVALMFSGESAMSLEQPKYTVLYKDGDIEYRQYEPYLVSEAVIENAGDYNDAGNEGFRRLFRYITGSNESQAKIDMTAPVAQSQGSETQGSETQGSEKIKMTVPVQQTESSDGWRVTFMLPSQYTLETAPVPTDPGVSVRAVPGRLMAVLRYSGRWTERNYVEKQSELREAIEAESVTPIGQMRSALYNPPYTPPFMRRNEVMVEVSTLPVAATDLASTQQATAY
jgi:hypothetical protein